MGIFVWMSCFRGRKFIADRWRALDAFYRFYSILSAPFIWSSCRFFGTAVDPSIGVHLSRKIRRSDGLSEDLECGPMPGFGMVSACGWPRTHSALGILSFHRS